MAGEYTDERARKKQKTNGAEMDPRNNPYLAHHYEGHSNKDNNETGLASFQRHATTAEQAQELEDGPLNPFNGAELSKR